MLKILIVEDEPPIARVMKSLIERLSDEYKIVDIAFNGQKAIDLLKEQKIDIIFSDIKMPVMDGLELAKEVIEKYNHIPIVLVSGYKDFDYAKRAIQYGVCDYLLKPINMEELKDVLNRIREKISVISSVSDETNTDNEEIQNISQEKIPIIVKKIDEYILQNYMNKVNNAVLSQEFGLVPSYLSKVFRNYKGVSPIEYITNLRIEESKRLMKEEPDMLLKEISMKIGFSDQNYFSKIFKKETGMWPSEYLTNKRDCHTYD